MILMSFGTPSALSYALSQIIDTIASVVIGDHGSLYAVFVDDLRQRWRALEPKLLENITIFSDLPTPEMSELFVNSQAPIVISTDNFDFLTRYIMLDRGHDFVSAVRFASQATCMLQPYTQSPNILRVTSEVYSQKLTDTIELLLNFYGLKCDNEQFKSILERITPPGVVDPTFKDYAYHRYPLACDIYKNESQLESGQEETLREIALGYDRIVSAENVVSLSCPIALLQNEKGALARSRRLDLSGPARFIAFGPYLHLPAGQWRARARVETYDCYSDNHITVDAYSSQPLALGEFKLPVSGRFWFDLPFEITNPFLPVEIRFLLSRGAIEGEFALHELEFRRE